MKHLKLLPLDVAIYEGIKAGKSITQITKENDETATNVHSRIKRLVHLGGLSRERIYHKPSKYTALDITYETVTSKQKTKEEPVEDTLLKGIAVELSEKDMQTIRANLKTPSRTKLAKEIGITKLQLNHIMNEMNSRKKPAGNTLDVPK